MIKAVILDMDGLMIDSETVTFACYSEVLKELGYPFNIEMYKNFLGKNGARVQKMLVEYYGDAFPLETAWKEVYGRVQAHMRKSVPIKKGLIELLQYLKANNYKTIVATGSARYRVNEIFTSANLHPYFDDMICGDEIKNSKPDPEIFLTACKKLNVSTDEVLVLEDSEAGILAAHNGNMKVICIPDMKYPEKEYESKAYRIFDSLLDVISYLKKEGA